MTTELTHLGPGFTKIIYERGSSMWYGPWHNTEYMAVQHNRAQMMRKATRWRNRAICTVRIKSLKGKSL